MSRNPCCCAAVLSNRGDADRGARKASKGQALVEFTLIFMLMLVIAWIPADFGLAFFTGQLMSNAAREGARIGSAMPSFNASEVVNVTCQRLPSALLSDPGSGGTSCMPVSRARVSVTLDSSGGTCNQRVIVRVQGNYNFFFYELLRFFGASGNFDSETLTRETSMRWEHGC
ncbi:MAG TPA: TadE/TadG family type IV pilus assembly protein [candidate division Zixibacteria bacterium]|nr:TadE/TadG family type IV pilus assembly protein [candidate division Zixibacteria bacterium]